LRSPVRGDRLIRYDGGMTASALRVCSFESRRSVEMRSLIERQGAIATVAPSMREVPLESNTGAFEFVESLLNGRIDIVVFLTGVGARTLLETIEPRFGRERFFDALRKVTVAVRGPKPVAVLREWNVPIAIRAAEPNTWHELVNALEAGVTLGGKRIAIQEYGRPVDALYRALSDRGAIVEPVPVYRWMLPEETGPLEGAIGDTIAGRFDVLLFTSAHQLDCVLEFADSIGQKSEWLTAARACVIGSIGPTASETIRESGLPVDVEASPTKMGQLVRAAIEAAPTILAEIKSSRCTRERGA
jgi:uroporphyrinogen-III synthase